jgi:hypothetical protein
LVLVVMAEPRWSTETRRALQLVASEALELQAAAAGLPRQLVAVRLSMVQRAQQDDSCLCVQRFCAHKQRIFDEEKEQLEHISFLSGYSKMIDE